MSRRVRMFVGMLALMMALGGSLQVSAQVDEEDVPEGALDGAAVSYSPGTDEDPLAPFFTFSVFVFDDEDSAADALVAYTEQIEDEVAVLVEEDASLAGAELIEVDDEDLDGLDELGDEATAYRVTLGNEGGSLDISLLSVQDGDMVHIWTTFVIDLSVALGEDGGEATAEPIDPLIGLTDMVGIADDWFGGDKPDEGDLIDQLPTLDALPDGYIEEERSESLEEIQGE